MVDHRPENPTPHQREGIIVKDYLEGQIAQAIADPGSVVGHCLGPSWGRGTPGYAPRQESITAWATRAVMRTLARENRVLPLTHRSATFRPGVDGRDPSMVIMVDAPTDIFRFAINMLDWQCEFGSAARAVLVELRDHMTPERFDPMARMMLGDTRYEQLRDRFERHWDCVSCEKDIRPGWKYAPTHDAGAVCAACCKGHPEWVAKLVKRPTESVEVSA
jgi:hypothetical protein